MEGRAHYKPAARAEIRDIAQYLEAQRPGFGRAFIEEIRRVEGLVLDNPGLYQAVNGPIRRAPLRRFRYGLFYVLEDEEVLVLACLHLHRGPRSFLDLIRR
jgi:plasmid stabilization system protein ParE